MLARSISRYCSVPSVPSHMFSISALVPEMIWRRLFSSLAALETESLEIDLRAAGGCLPSVFTGAFFSNLSAGFAGNYRALVCQSGPGGQGLVSRKTDSQSCGIGLYFRPLS